MGSETVWAAVCVGAMACSGSEAVRIERKTETRMNPAIKVSESLMAMNNAGATNALRLVTRLAVREHSHVKRQRPHHRHHLPHASQTRRRRGSPRRRQSARGGADLARQGQSGAGGGGGDRYRDSAKRHDA